MIAARFPQIMARRLFVSAGIITNMTSSRPSADAAFRYDRSRATRRRADDRHLRSRQWMVITAREKCCFFSSMRNRNRPAPSLGRQLADGGSHFGDSWPLRRIRPDGHQRERRADRAVMPLMMSRASAYRPIATRSSNMSSSDALIAVRVGGRRFRPRHL